MRISAIVLNHEHLRFLPERLDSVVGQTWRPDELILLDDASCDGSAEWLQRFHAEILLRRDLRTTRSGNPFAMWNAGAGMATGDWLWIAESDDSCQPALLATLAEAARRNPDAAIVFCQSEIIDADGRASGTFLDYTRGYDTETWRTDFVCPGNQAATELLLPRNTIPNASACLFSRRAWDAAGGAVEDLPLSGDWATYGRLLRHGPLVFCAAALNQHRHHANTQRSRTSANEFVRQDYEARRRIATWHGVSAAAREFAARYALGDAAARCGVSPENLPDFLGPEVSATAVSFDPDFVRRCADRRLRQWDRCEVFCEPQGRFGPENQRTSALRTPGGWNSLRFTACAGRIRLDPFARPGRGAIQNLALRETRSGRTLWAPARTEAWARLTASPGVRLAPDGSLLAIESTHDDPQLILPADLVPAGSTCDLYVEIRPPLE